MCQESIQKLVSFFIKVKDTNTNVWVAMILTVIGFIISFFPLWNIIFFIVIIFSLKLNINVWSKKNKLFGTIGIVISIVAVIVTVCMYLDLPKYRKIATIEGMDKKVSANMINEDFGASFSLFFCNPRI